jgi:hypothetical protein
MHTGTRWTLRIRPASRGLVYAGALAAGLIAVLMFATCTNTTPPTPDGACPSPPPTDGAVTTDATASDGGTSDPVAQNALRMVDEGRQTFRFDTFGDEAFWGDSLQLHRAIAGAANGGVGPGLSPTAALGVGLKVDMDALPAALVEQIRAQMVNLNDPATTLALLRLNAVVGVTGRFNPDMSIRSVGIQCALCHSTVDDAFAPGIGHRRDGWANRDLNVGAIIALAPNLEPFTRLLGVDAATLRTVLMGWGPGRFDAEVFFDGRAMRPDGRTAATLIPPAYGLAGVNLHTWTGWGGVTHWNALVANLEMHGQGTFYDPRLDDATRFPIAARERFGHTRATQDLITPRLGALQVYQLTLAAPTPPAGSFDAAAAERGRGLFEGAARCATCHVPPLYTEPGWNMHTAAEIGIDDFQAQRSPDVRYRTSPLRGLFAHARGGFYHDGRFATMADVVDHYNTALSLNLTAAQRADLVEYLKSL